MRSLPDCTSAFSSANTSTPTKKIANHTVSREALIEPLCALAAEGWLWSVPRESFASRSRQASMFEMSIVSRSQVG